MGGGVEGGGATRARGGRVPRPELLLLWEFTLVTGRRRSFSFELSDTPGLPQKFTKIPHKMTIGIARKRSIRFIAGSDARGGRVQGWDVKVHVGGRCRANVA